MPGILCIASNSITVQRYSVFFSTALNHAALPVRAGHLDLLAEVRGLVLNERVLGDLEPGCGAFCFLLPLGGISADGVRAGYGPPRKMTLFGSSNIVKNRAVLGYFL